MDIEKQTVYKKTIREFINTKHCHYNNEFSDDFLDDVFTMSKYHWFPTIFLTSYKQIAKTNKRNAKGGIYLATGLVLLVIAISVIDNEEYFKDKYNNDIVNIILEKILLYIPMTIRQNETILREELQNEGILSKISRNINNYLYEKDKLLNMTQIPEFQKLAKMKKSDILKFKFTDPIFVENKLKTMYVVDREEMMNNVVKKFGTFGELICLFSSYMGNTNEEHAENNEKENNKIMCIMGTSLGIIIKIANDFENLERDIKCSKLISNNLVVNYGIRDCYEIYLEHLTKFLQLCELKGLYKTTIKEILETIEYIMDTNIENADIELKSQYSAFSSHSYNKQ